MKRMNQMSTPPFWGVYREGFGVRSKIWAHFSLFPASLFSLSSLFSPLFSKAMGHNQSGDSSLFIFSP